MPTPTGVKPSATKRAKILSPAHEGVAQTIAKVIAKLAAQHGPVVLSDQIRPELREGGRSPLIACGAGRMRVCVRSCTSTIAKRRVGVGAGKACKQLANCGSGAFPGSQGTGRRAMRLWLSRASTRGTQRVLKSLRG